MLTHPKNRPDLVEMAVCGIQTTFRGGSFDDKKLFEKKDRIVLILVIWNGEGEARLAERLAIGDADLVVWERLERVRKLVRLR